ncbi:MAG: GNAT family N-acetyltransferase [Chloroflexi bacterium]|nr:GNAT family N-acetyltransferase [Chloroflexota bacterium]MCI0725303.1 GNAT family N-acetyltransferase [Chloroflexota bacterium]
MGKEEPCQLLPWDSNFFGHRIARVVDNRLNTQRIEDILAWCREQAIECLYFLADANHSETIRLAEDNGFRLVDIRQTLQWRPWPHLPEHRVKPTRTIEIRPSRVEDIPSLEAMARTIYSGTRFYSDPCFSKELCDALYATWIKRSCEGYANIVFVAEVENALAGYVSCHLPDGSSQGQIGLVGIGPQVQGRGIGQILVEQALHWFTEQGVETVDVVTQGRNVAAQRLYQRCGFVSSSVQLWYHKWIMACHS